MSARSAIALILVIVSCLEETHFQLGGQTIRPAYLLALAVLLSLSLRNKLSHRFVILTSLFLVLVFMASLPSVLVYGMSRFSIALQIMANVTVFLALLGLLWGRREATAWVVRWAIFVVAGMTLFQLLFLPGKTLAPRLLGMVRPSASFEEPTWLAIFMAFAALAAMQVGSRWMAMIAACFVLEISTLSAILLLGFGTLVYVFRHVRLGRALSSIGILSAWAGSVLVFSHWLSDEPVIRGSESLDTRQLDVFIVREANPSLLPWGGPNLHVFDPVRERLVPDTSNVLPLDMIWKLGFGGLAAIVLVAVFLFLCSRLAGAGPRQISASPALAAVMLLVPLCTSNNSLGRPWTWAMLALCLTAWQSSSLTRQAVPAAGDGQVQPRGRAVGRRV